MDNWREQDRQSHRDDCWDIYPPGGIPNRYDIWTKVNLLNATKEMLEQVVMRGRVENEMEKILVSTAALVGTFLCGQSVDSELCVRIRERQKDMGLFFPPLAGTFFEWEREGKQNMIKEIKALSRD